MGIQPIQQSRVIAYLMTNSTARTLYQRLQAMKDKQYLTDEEAQVMKIRFSSLDLFAGETSKPNTCFSDLRHARIIMSQKAELRLMILPGTLAVSCDLMLWCVHMFNMHARSAGRLNVPMSTSCTSPLSFFSMQIPS